MTCSTSFLCRRILPVVALVLCLFIPAFSQLTAAGLRGTVTDANGNFIISSPVVAKNQETGQIRTTTTDNNGAFLLAGLTPGNYTIYVRVVGFKTYENQTLRLSTGQTTDINIRLEIGEVQETVDVVAGGAAASVSNEARLSDALDQKSIANLPLPQRDIFLLPQLSAGATFIPGAANSTKLTSSPVVTVNGNRYRGNNYVLDGAMNTNPNNTGEPALVPSVDSVEEVQVQTLNFSSEFGRGNGAVINIQTKSGTNQFHGRLWEFHRNAALNARNFFATERTPLVFNQFGGNIGGPIFKDRTFFFGAYEGTRNAVGRAYAFQVETPEFRDYVFRTAPNGVAARLLQQFPAPAPIVANSGTNRYVDQRNLTTPQGVIPAIGRAAVTIHDYVRFDQYLGRIDHTFNNGADKLSGRWIAEYQKDEGGTSSAQATLGRALRGSRGPFNGLFANLNLGYAHVFARAVNDARFSFQHIRTVRGVEDATVPTITITGVTAPFGDVFSSATRLRTYEFRDTVTLDRGRHAVRLGVEARRIFKGLSIGRPDAGTFLFSSIGDFAVDRPFRQTLTVSPDTGEPTNFPRYFTFYETGFFIQDDWKVNQRLNINLGLRHDYFGTARAREDRLSSIILGAGASFEEQLANAGIGRVERLYNPEKTNFSPRVGLAFDPIGDGTTSIRAGFSMAYQPHHGQSINGARALPPDAIQGVIQPSNRIGTSILYDIPVPFNAEFARGLNAQGGVISRPGEPAIRTTGFVVNPDIKTQYTESWFLNAQREFQQGWIAELGYVGTTGINLERIDDVNRVTGDLLDGREDRINRNFGVLLFVTNGVTSSYQAMTAELRRRFSGGLSFQTNYRWSKWLDTSSDTSTGQFQDNSEPGKGAAEISCLRCERARSLFDIPHRFSASMLWTPQLFQGGSDLVSLIFNNWQLATIVTAQSGRPFSVWNGAPATIRRDTAGQIIGFDGGDYNLDGGGGAVGGGFYDRPNAPSVATDSSFDRANFLNGLFDPSIFSRPAPGQNGTLGRNTYRGPRYITFDFALSRSFTVKAEKQLQLRLEAFNAFNNVNLFLPNADLSVSNFGKSTQAFEPRTLQGGIRFIF